MHNRFTAAPPLPASSTLLGAQIEMMALACGDAIALTEGANQVSYRDLLRRADALAWALQSRGIGPGDLVGVSIQRSVELVIAIVGIVRSGAAYVPLDLHHPAERRLRILADAAPRLVVTDGSPPEGIPAGMTVLPLPVHATGNPGQLPIPSPGDPCYVIYTSGSTGQPKGVVITQRNVAHLFKATAAWIQFNPSDVWTLFHSIAFDFTVWELWGALLHGGRLLIPSHETTRSPERYHRMVLDEGVTILNQTPTAFRSFFGAHQQAGMPDTALRLVALGAEALDPRTLRAWTDRHGDETPQLINLYGPTEATVYATYYRVRCDDTQGSGACCIGQSIADMSVRLVDASGTPVPSGTAGEIIICGAGVAAGYLNRPDLTRERFLHGAGEDDARQYRSGDLGRLMPDGNLAFLGRADNQIKLRGYRIELGEIEAILRQANGVLDAVVTKRERAATGAYLAAYIVAHKGATPDVNALHAFVARRLPDYMVPAAFVRIDRIPRTLSDKIDLGALPDADATMFRPAASIVVEPRNPVERHLRDIWREVLGIADLGIHDDFLLSGGDSLNAARLSARCQDVLGPCVSMGHILESRTVAGLAERLARSGDAPGLVSEEGDACHAPDTANDAGLERLPLSFGEEQMWFLHRLHPESAAYNETVAMHLKGDVDTERLAKAIAALMRSHEILRTNYLDDNGLPYRSVQAPDGVVAPFSIETPAPQVAVNDASRTQVLQAEAIKPFNLPDGPLFRVRLFQWNKTDQTLLFVFHHIICDDWSLRIFFNELSANYRATPDAAPPQYQARPRYSAFARQQREAHQGPALQANLNFWRRALDGASSAVKLPVDRAHLAVPAQRGAVASFRIEPEVVQAMRSIGLADGATLFTTMLAAFHAFIHRWSGQEDITIGTPVAQRDHPEWQHLAGYCLNTLPVRGDISGDPTFRELLVRVRSALLGAYAHQSVPFARLVEEFAPQRDSIRSPLFQILFALLNEPTPCLTLPGVTIEPVRVTTGTSKFDLTLLLEPEGDGLNGRLEYNTGLFDAATIERMLSHFAVMLADLTVHPDRALSELSLLNSAERHRLLLEWNDTALDYPRQACLHQLFEAQTARTPDGAAVLFENTQTTYRELNARANQLAHALRERGVGANTPVGLVAARSANYCVGVLGILKAGGACVTLDPAYPADRLRFMLKDIQVEVIVVPDDSPIDFPIAFVPVIALNGDREQLASRPVENTESLTRSTDMAYVIFTSGSTGTPKGVAMPHRPLVNLICWQCRESPVAADTRTLQYAPLSFDVSFQELFSTWCGGGTLVLLENVVRRDFPALLRLINRDRIERIFVPPFALHGLAAIAQEIDVLPSSLKEVITAGESLRITPPVRYLFERLNGCTLTNQYGPSETHVASFYRLDGSPGDWPELPPIGTPIQNAKLYILDGHQRPVPIGVPGELCIGGECLARGYINHPLLTAQKFQPDPFSTAPDARMYLTGDHARYLPSGNIEFLGRNDNQVKMRGFRIELEEIENVLTEHPSVCHAVVLVREDEPGEKRLVAYVAPNEASYVGTAPLRTFLRERLPDYMRPSAYWVLEHLPLTPTGKIDRRALSALQQGPGENQDTLIQPRSSLEETVAEVWREMLALDQIGVHDNFFDLGGHSLLAARTLARLAKRLKVELPLRDFFESPTISALAAAAAKKLGARETREDKAITSIPRDQNLSLSYAQRRLWILDRLLPNKAAYNIPSAWRLRGPLDVPVLERSLNVLVARHETLRTRFVMNDNAPLVVINPPRTVALPLVDLAAIPQIGREAHVQQILNSEAHQPFDLEAGPVLRMQLLRLAAQEHVLLFNIHHIASDGWSTGVFERELSVVYSALLKRQEPPLQNLPVQYADYAAWQYEWMRGELLENQLDYWTRQLTGVTAMELPADRPRPPVASYKGGLFTLDLPEPLTTALKVLGRNERATLFMTLLAGFLVLLHRYSGQTDIAVGTPIAGRGHTELEGLIGLFVNTLVLRSDVAGNPRFRDLLGQIRETALSAYNHQDLPVEKVIESLAPIRDMSRNPLFQVMFILQNTPNSTLALDGIAVRTMPISNQGAKFDLTLSMRESAEGLQACWEYASDLFDVATIERMARNYARLLEAIVAEPEKRIGELPLLVESERHQLLVTWNDTARDYGTETRLHRLFERQVTQTPDTIALRFEQQELTYAELNRRANQLAHALRARGVTSEILVGVFSERSLEMVAALLAVLKAGGAFLPLDPSYPLARLRHMLEDAKTSFVLTQPQLASKLPENAAALLLLDASGAAYAYESDQNLEDTNTADTPAYVIFTSGSTGRPKGAMNTHRGICNRLLWMQEEYDIGCEDRVLQKTPLSFDVSVWELFWPLLAGAQLVIACPEGHLDNAYLVRLIRERGITTLHFVPSMLRMFLKEHDVNACNSIKRVICSGETLPYGLQEIFFTQLPSVELHNLYGPTETAVDVTYWACQKGDDRLRVPIGRPVANTQIYVLDSRMTPTPIGVPGELYIGGVQVSGGYIGRPELTAERFVPDPFSTSPSARLYRTGDLVRYLADGNIDYLGRLDQQVKIHGVRIELGEIAACLVEHRSVDEATVVVRHAANGNPQLVAFVTLADANADPGLPQSLIQWTAERLPSTMLPTVVIPIRELPRTLNGKLDVAALPGINLKDISRQNDTPLDSIEVVILSIWKDILCQPDLCADDDFFTFGGDSMLAIRMLARLDRELGMRLPPRSVMMGSTVRRLAHILRNPTLLTSEYPAGFVMIGDTLVGRPVFCIPGVGGVAFDFRRLVARMRTDRPFFAVEIHDVDVPLSVLESVPATAAAIAQRILQVQPAGPYAIIGYSYGGHVAFEIARALVATGKTVEITVILDAYAPGVLQPLTGLKKLWEHLRQLSRLDRGGIVHYLWSRAKRKLRLADRQANARYSEAGVQVTEIEQHILSTSAPCIRAIHAYRPGIYSGRLSIICATDLNEWLEIEDVTGTLGWSKLCTGDIELASLKCRHLDLFKDPYIDDVAGQIDEVLSRLAK